MAKSTIAIDIDDVLSDSTDLVRRIVNDHLNVGLTTEHYRTPGSYWNYYERVWDEHGLTQKMDVPAVVERIRQSKHTAIPHEHAFDALQELSRTYRLIVITARKDTWEAITRQWLELHFPGIFSEVIFGGGHEGIQLKSKGELCRENKADWLIDDSVEHAHSALDAGLRCILFGDYGWHKGQDIRKNVVRCTNWRDVREYFNGQD